MSTETHSGDDFTPEEQAAFDSYKVGVPAEPAPVQSHEPAPQQSAPSEPANDEEAVDGEVALDVNGNARDLKSGKFVPKSAFLRIKEEAKTLKAESQQLRDTVVQARERLAILTEATAPQPQAQQLTEDKEPDPETDLFAWVSWSRRQMATLKEQLAKTSTETREQFEARALKETFQHDVQTFMQQTPTFKDGYAYLVNQRHTELAALGVSDQAKRDQIIAEEARDLVQSAIKNRQSPAALIYQLATARGFTPKTANDDAAAKVAQEIERIKQGQQAAQSLRGAGSGAGVGEQLTMARLAAMSDEDYATTRSSYISKHGKAEWSRITGMP